MSMYKKINNAKFDAMKNKDDITKGILTVFQGDITTLAKKMNSEINDELCLQVLAKMKKSINETLKFKSTPKLEAELKVIESYLPKQLSEEEIKTIVLENGLKTTNDAFKFFAKNHKGLYNSSTIQSIFNN